MWYIFGARWIHDELNQKKERIYKIGHALSSDNINWLKDEQEIIPNRIGEDECQALPTAILIGDTYHMYFCYRYATDFRDNKDRAYRMGYAYSKDLIHWTRNDSLAGIDVSESGWDSEMQCYPHIFKVDDNIYMLYNGNEFGRLGFGLAKLEK
jgi:sucrose-6-phosphate hydrolase SacC (GH32 family)